MTKPNLIAAPALLALVVLCGGGCEYFRTITVPAVDNSPPTGGTRFLANDGDDQIRFDGFTEVIHGDLGKSYSIFPFGFDNGGVQELTISRAVARSCTNGGIGSSTHYSFLDQTQSGNESAGQSAPNGRYGAFSFNPNTYVTAGENCTVDMGWVVEITDYGGNTTYASGSIRYVP